MKKRKNIILNILLVVFIVTAGVSGYLLFKYYHETNENEDFVSSLKDLVDEDATDTVEAAETVPKTVKVNDEDILQKYLKLYEKNKDFIGWIYIEGAKIDYPVMQCKENEKKYLRANFDGEYALAGTPFMAAGCDAKKPSTNLIIYGHNMKSGYMFGDLDEYLDAEYLNKHRIIHFDTIYGLNQYQVVAAFHLTLNSPGETGYYFHGFMEAETQGELNEFLEEVNKKNEIDTTVTATMNDHFLTLSTCDDYGAHEGRRFLVIAKKIEK